MCDKCGAMRPLPHYSHKPNSSDSGPPRRDKRVRLDHLVPRPTHMVFRAGLPVAGLHDDSKGEAVVKLGHHTVMVIMDVSLSECRRLASTIDLYPSSGDRTHFKPNGSDGR